MNINEGKGYFCLNGTRYPKSSSHLYMYEHGAISIKLIQYGSYSYIIFI